MGEQTRWQNFKFICENSHWLATHRCPLWRVVRYFFTGYTGEYRNGCMTRDYRRWFAKKPTTAEIAKIAALVTITQELTRFDEQAVSAANTQPEAK